MKHADLPERWKQKIAEHLDKEGRKEDSKLSAFDFNPNQEVELKFEDDSFANFKYAFIIRAPEFGEIGVFTEHCGYHIFNIYVEAKEIKLGNRE